MATNKSARTADGDFLTLQLHANSKSSLIMPAVDQPRRNDDRPESTSLL
jgi:hypothetical protein